MEIYKYDMPITSRAKKMGSISILNDFKVFAKPSER